MLRKSIVLAFLAVLISSPAWSYVHRESVEKAIPTEGRSTIRVSNPTGLIKIRPADGSDVILEAKKIAKAKTETGAKDLAADARVRVIERSDEIEIKVELPSKTKHRSLLGGILKLSVSTHVTVELYLEVPPSMELHLGSTSGDIDVEGAQAGGHLGATSGDVWVSDCSGDFSIAVASGDIEVEGVQGNLDLSAASGDITVREIRGDVGVSTASGNLLARGVEGMFTLDGASGEVTVEDCGDDVEVDTASGDVWLKGVSGEVAVSTSSGDVTVQSVAGGAVAVEIACSSGDIELVIAKGSSYHLELDTVSGGISCKVPLTVEKLTRRELRGDVGSGRGSVILSTSSGDIRVREG